MNVEIRSAFVQNRDDIWHCIVTTKGYSYFVTHTGDKPTEEEITWAWKHTRYLFSPWNAAQ